MKELEIKVINDLISFYSEYIVSGVNDKLKKKAMEVESRYLNTSTLVSDVVTQALGRLVDFYADIGIKPLTKSEARQILENLKKRKQELQ